MSEISNIEMGVMGMTGGNTNSPPSVISHSKNKNGSKGSNGSKIHQSNYWCFTWFKYNDEKIEKFLKFLHRCEKTLYCFQEEICPETKREHLQGGIWFNSKVGIRDTTIKKHSDNSIHLEFMISSVGSKKYCLKDDTKKPNGRVWQNIKRIIKDPLAGLEYKEWQKHINDIISTEPDRKVYWFRDQIGGQGKSSFVKHIRLIRNDTIRADGDKKDVYFIINMHLNNKKDIKAVFLDIPRTQININYSMIENIKNGDIVSGKYESCELLFDTPHLFIFSNRFPELDKLSMDRWVIYDINVDGSFIEINKDDI